ncbi:MAG: hypothetical protein V4622_06540 [Bacteroidota bacterium]
MVDLKSKITKTINSKKVISEISILGMLVLISIDGNNKVPTIENNSRN